MQGERNRHEELNMLAGRIVETDPRRLFELYTSELLEMSDALVMNVGSFSVRFSDPAGFMIVCSPYRDLFLVSVGASPACDIRVRSKEGLVRALDLTVQHFLETSISSSGADR